MLTAAKVRQIARALHRAERHRQQIPATTLRHPAMDMDDAYAIQRAWVDIKIAEGAVLTGYKVGLTSKAMQKAMNIDEPDYGTLLDEMFYNNGDTIRAGDFTDPYIEVELAFILKAPLRGEDVSVDDVLDATDYITPALELIAARSYRIDPDSGYTRTVFDTIADNAGNAAVIMGEQRLPPGAVDLRWAGAMLYKNDAVEETGLAAAVLDHPANGIIWVAKRFARHGVGLEPGQVILAGSFTRPVGVKAGDHIRADYGPLGELACQFV